MLFPENLVVFNVFYVNLGCLSIGWRLIYRLILNMQNLSAKSFFLLALSFFSFYPSHPSCFLFFNLLIMRWLSLLCSVIDRRNVYKIHHAIHHVCLYPSRLSAYLLAESAFFMHVIRDKDESFRDKACIWL